MMIRSFPAIAMVLLLAGCVTTPVAREKPPTVVGTGTAEDAVASDPCATRMHEIAGAMLQYFAINKHLPAKLEELSAMADLDQPLNFTCPTSHLAYVYVPNGLEAPGGTKRIILHDAAPSHNGVRYCLLMAPAGAGTSQSMEVLPIAEPIFRAYTPVTSIDVR